MRTRGMLAVLLVELVVAALVVYGLYALRTQTLNSELRMLGSLSAAMAADADGTLDVADVVLRATRTELANCCNPLTPAPGRCSRRAWRRCRRTRR